MYDPEYQLPSGRNYREHKRIIRAMMREMKGMPPNPIACALVEIAVTVAVSSLWIAICVCGWRWLLMV